MALFSHGIMNLFAQQTTTTWQRQIRRLWKLKCILLCQRRVTTNPKAPICEFGQWLAQLFVMQSTTVTRREYECHTRLQRVHLHRRPIQSVQCTVHAYCHLAKLLSEPAFSHSFNLLFYILSHSGKNHFIRNAYNFILTINHSAYTHKLYFVCPAFVYLWLCTIVCVRYVFCVRVSVCSTRLGECENCKLLQNSRCLK